MRKERTLAHLHKRTVQSSGIAVPGTVSSGQKPTDRSRPVADPAVLPLHGRSVNRPAAMPLANRMKRKVFAEATNEVRKSLWVLVQSDDRTLHVEQNAQYRDGARHQRTVSINDFMLESGPPPRALQALLDKLFSRN